MAAPFHPDFIQHQGRRILRLDYSGLALDDFVVALRRAETVIMAEPRDSVLALTIWSATLTSETVETIKQHVAHNTPYIRASAVVTPKPFQKVVFEGIRIAGRERLKTFDDEQRAKDWLAAR